MDLLFRTYIYLIVIMSFYVPNKAFCQDMPDNNYGKLKLVVNYNLSLPNDTLILRIGTTSIDNQYDEYTTVRDTNGRFEFVVDNLYQYGYFRLIKNRSTGKNDSRILIGNHFWESGDSLKINIEERHYPDLPLILREYNGTGSAKYQAWELIEQSTPSFMEKLKRSNATSEKFYSWDDVANDKLKILEKYQHQMSPLAYDVLKIKALMRKWTGDMIRISNVIPEISEQPLEAENLKKLYFPLKKWVDNDEALANSIEYIRFYTLHFSLYPVYSQGKYDKEKFPHANIDVQKSLESIKNSSSGKIQQALTVHLLSTVGYSPTLKPIYEQVSTYLTDPYYSKQLEKLTSVELKNISQYVFTDVKGREIQISDFKGKILFIDTWFTGCPGCAAYYKTVVSKVEEHFKEEDHLALLSISSNQSKETWLKSISAGLYCNPSGINLYTSGQKMDHPMYQYLGIKSGPTAMLVDTNGDVLFLNTPELYDLDELINHIEKLL